MELREMDERTTYMQQLREDGGPVVLMNQFNMPPEDVERVGCVNPIGPYESRIPARRQTRSEI